MTQYHDHESFLRTTIRQQALYHFPFWPIFVVSIPENVRSWDVLAGTIRSTASPQGNRVLRLGRECRRG